MLGWVHDTDDAIAIFRFFRDFWPPNSRRVRGKIEHVLFLKNASRNNFSASDSQHAVCKHNSKSTCAKKTRAYYRNTQANSRVSVQGPLDLLF
jgi:hypothetical protein